MPFQKVEFEFPDAQEDNEELKLDIEDSSAKEVEVGATNAEAESEEEYELEVVDDTPKADRNRKPSDPPEDVTDEELEDYSEKVRRRIQHFSKGYHDERRAKEQAQREREELERLSHKLLEENKELKSSVNKNQSALLDQAKKNAAVEM